MQSRPKIEGSIIRAAEPDFSESTRGHADLRYGFEDLEEERQAADRLKAALRRGSTLP
jgi:hypothetical protein